MILEIGGVILTASIFIGAVAFKKNGNAPDKHKKNIDVIVNDYMRIKTGYRNFMKTENRILDSLEDLHPYIEEKKDIAFSHYGISEDGKYLVVKKIDEKSSNIILDKIGGTSYYKGNHLYLSFLSLKKVSRVEPVAKLKIFPEGEIFTTTTLEYSLTESIAEDGEIKETFLTGNETRFSNPGEYVVKAKILDKNDNWSKLVEKTIIVKENEKIKGVYSGNDQLCLLGKNGKFYMYGSNDFGEFGDSTSIKKEKLELNLRIDNIADIDFGNEFGIYRTYDGFVYCSGKNNFGQLGTGDRHNSKFMKKVWGIENVVEIKAGADFAGALTGDGKLYLWGNNDEGQLCKMDTLYSEMPEAIIEIEKVRSFSLGYNHGLALLYNGNVMSWGDNKFGQLGLGYKSKNSQIPIMSEFKSVKKVFAGNGFSMIITENGKVFSLGQNNRNQLGFTGEKEVMFPQEIIGLKNIIKLSSRGKFVVALDERGHVYTWGQYRPNDTVYDIKPKKIENLPFIHDIAASIKNGYGMDIDGKIYRWGSDYNNKEIIEIPNENEK